MFQFLVPHLFAAAAAVGPPVGYHESFRGDDLLNLCIGQSARVAECDQYIAGVRGGMAAQRLAITFVLDREGIEPNETVARLLAHEPFCDIPNNVSQTELRDVVTSFIAKDDEVRKSSAAFAIVIALRVRYRCSEDRSNISPIPHPLRGTD